MFLKIIPYSPANMKEKNLHLVRKSPQCKGFAPMGTGRRSGFY